MGTHFNWIETLRTSPTLMALVGFSVVTLGITLERIHYYWKRRGSPHETLAQVLRRLHSGDIRGAFDLCKSCSHPMGPVAADILENRCVGDEEAEEKLQIALSEQKLLLERNLGVLGTMAAVSPLVGLLGTVWGIMRAFSDMSATGSGSPAIVAAGVAEALITTAVGIMIAVPALMLYNTFARRMSVMLTVAENNARSIRAAMSSTVDRRPADADIREARENAMRPAARPADELEPVR